jgi:hypothetical protein
LRIWTPLRTARENMKKIVVLAGLGLALLAIASFIVLRGISAKGPAAAALMQQVSPKTAESLQAKIDAVRDADKIPGHRGGRLELSEFELESYVLYALKKDIPVQIDAMDVKLEPDTVASETQLTFASNSTGNPMVDSVIEGTHNLFLKGMLVGQEGRGRFELQEIRIDGIPVPKILIETLFDKYVNPRYPDADLKAPFDLPWGIEELKLADGKATVLY